VEFSRLFVLVSSGMGIAAWFGWRIGQLMSPRPEVLRRAAADSETNLPIWNVSLSIPVSSRLPHGIVDRKGMVDASGRA
jgi:hypothetical protein